LKYCRSAIENLYIPVTCWNATSFFTHWDFYMNQLNNMNQPCKTDENCDRLKMRSLFDQLSKACP
jgi:hypothetical protein